MKANYLIVLATLLGAITAAWAQDGTTNQRTFGNGVHSEFLSMYDVDNDGKFSAEEMQALQADRNTRSNHTRFRDRWDTNRDNRISPAERAAAIASIRNVIRQRRCDRFDEVDLRGAAEGDGPDGFLSLAEFKGISAVNSSNLDRPGLAESLFDKLDRNDDNRISKAEFLRTLDEVRPSPVDPNDAPRPTTHEETSDGNRR